MLDETKLEQAVAKAHHQNALNTWYEESWVQKDAINDETDTQATQWNRWQQERAEIEQNIVASEAQKKVSCFLMVPCYFNSASVCMSLADPLSSSPNSWCCL